MKATQETIKDEGWEEVKEERDEANHVSWENPGTTVIGVLEEIFDASDGARYAKVNTGDEKLTMFSLPSILDSKLKTLLKKKVKIVYLGEIQFKNKRKGKDFQVFKGSQ